MFLQYLQCKMPKANVVLAALSERVCDSSLIERTCITPLSHIVQWIHVTEFSRVVVECEDAGMVMHLQMWHAILLNRDNC